MSRLIEEVIDTGREIRQERHRISKDINVPHHLACEKDGYLCEEVPCRTAGELGSRSGLEEYTATHGG